MYKNSDILWTGYLIENTLVSFSTTDSEVNIGGWTLKLDPTDSNDIDIVLVGSNTDSGVKELLEKLEPGQEIRFRGQLLAIGSEQNPIQASAHSVQKLDKKISLAELNTLPRYVFKKQKRLFGTSSNDK